MLKRLRGEELGQLLCCRYFVADKAKGLVGPVIPEFRFYSHVSISCLKQPTCVTEFPRGFMYIHVNGLLTFAAVYECDQTDHWQFE